MEFMITLILVIILGYILYRFELYIYKKGMSKGFEVAIESLEEIESYAEHLLDEQEPESYRFYYAKGTHDAIEQVRGIVTNFKKYLEGK